MIDASVELGLLLRSKGWTVSTAESCTGGFIAHLITCVAGAADYFPGSVVSYCDRVKHRVLGVSADDLKHFTAVSETVARQMAEGVRKVMNSDVGIATTGIAGPGGANGSYSVGDVWMAVSIPHKTISKLFSFPDHTREEVISMASDAALRMTTELLSQSR